jgi:thiol-disulfide isomerase/thioredoxin
MKIFMFIAVILFCSNFSATVAQTVGTEIGNKAPEIRLPSPGGDTISLSSLKGKMVLIDFWATWCAPCLKEQPELAGLYKNYRHAEFTVGKGFEIYGVSLDSKKSSWENAISKNGISWIQVSDLKFWSSPVAKLYNIQELPFNVLIDGNGAILAKNLHGKDLKNEMAKYLLNK